MSDNYIKTEAADNITVKLPLSARYIARKVTAFHRVSCL